MQQYHPYYRLAAMTGLSFVAMYILVYAMVDTIDSVFNSLNQVYMAALMASPMVLIELALMGEMYPNKGLNRRIAAISIVALIGFFLLIRQQVAITDTQFLRSMIPHHSGAILMCAKAPIQGSELKDLCKTIIASQDAEIKQMRSMLGK
jgi:uncharacterized protein (DUF305 family)